MHEGKNTAPGSDTFISFLEQTRLKSVFMQHPLHPSYLQNDITSFIQAENSLLEINLSHNLFAHLGIM